RVPAARCRKVLYLAGNARARPAEATYRQDSARMGVLCGDGCTVFRLCGPRWEDISTRSFWENRSEGENTPGGNRGPVTLRLVNIEARGKTALAAICLDNRQTEVTIGESSDWKPYEPEIALTSPKLRRDNRSPTGWIVSGTWSPQMDRKDCERSFADEEPVVSRTGAPPGFD